MDPHSQHAQFCITVLDSEEYHDYTWYSSAARVVGGAKKTLILCYVERMASEEASLNFGRMGSSLMCFPVSKLER